MNYIIKEAVVKGKNHEYRYLLRRVWDTEKDMVTFITLNPSTADALVDDLTIRNCVKLAENNGFGGIEVVNLFAFRTAYPEELKGKDKDYLIGQENEKYILDSIIGTKKIVLAWGNSVKELKNIKYFERDKEIAELLEENNCDFYCVKLTPKGCPGHPLFVNGETTFSPIKWNGENFILA